MNAGLGLDLEKVLDVVHAAGRYAAGESSVGPTAAEVAAAVASAELALRRCRQSLERDTSRQSALSPFALDDGGRERERRGVERELRGLTALLTQLQEAWSHIEGSGGRNVA